ncbi:MAG: hypothetical protein QGH11_08130, partial [Pirellulaceae bacterium]|nr:hypothetical protein [Pirellulaceae bacterium]
MAILLFACLARQLPGQDEDLEYQDGLLATYRDSEAGRVTRVEKVMALNWQRGLPDARLSGNGFSGHWQGYVLIRSAGDYRFFLYTQGTVRLVI